MLRYSVGLFHLLFYIFDFFCSSFWLKVPFCGWVLWPSIPFKALVLLYRQCLNKLLTWNSSSFQSKGSLVWMGSMATEDVQMGIEMFDGSDFSYRRMQIKDYLFKRRLHLPLGPKPTKMEDWRLHERWTLLKSVAHSIMKEITMTRLILVLVNRYETWSINIRRWEKAQMFLFASINFIIFSWLT